jgi:putative ABC transport system permease protein
MAISDTLARELRFAARALKKTPAFTLTAAIALALGIGATTAMLSVLNAVLLRPLPYADADRLVVVLHQGRNPVAPANFIDWRAQTRSFSDMAAAEYWTPEMTGGDDPRQVLGLRMTGAMLPMLGVRPEIGRVFTENETQPGSEHVVVVSHGFWQRALGADRNVIGRQIPLSGASYTVIGVMPESFRFAPFWATRAEVWAPLVFGERASSRNGSSLRVFARLRSGTSIDQARRDLASVTARLEQQEPGTNRDVQIVPLKDKVVGDIRTPLAVLFVAVALVLLIACSNVAHMLLARSTSRQRELAIRTALGASRTRLIAQMLAESTLLAAFGAVLGLLLAAWGVRALVAASPVIIPRVADVSIDWRVLAVTLGVTVAMAIVFGLVPAWRAGADDLTGAFKESGSRGASESVGRGKLRNTLVASEFALALMLLIGAGLMIRSFIALQRIDPGFDPRGVVTMTVSTTGTAAADSSRHAAFYVDALARVRALPGVEAASYINHLPLAGDNWGTQFHVEGRPVPKAGESPRATYRVVFPGYFAAMRLPMLNGRDVAETDRVGSPRVVVINDHMARTYWPGENAVGKRITFDDSTFITVVGVVKNAAREQWSAPAEEEIYLPFFQQRTYIAGVGASRYMTLVVRGACARRECDASSLAAPVRNAIRSVEHGAPISDVQTMAEVVSRATATARFYLILLGAFAVVAVVLAAVGIYGVMSFAVSRREREIGIRIALGAEPGLVLGSVLRQSLSIAAAGAGAGLVAALLATRLMRGILYGVSATDAVTFASVTLLLLAVAAGASFIPAYRATRIDPLSALRGE